MKLSDLKAGDTFRFAVDVKNVYVEEDELNSLDVWSIWMNL